MAVLVTSPRFSFVRFSDSNSIDSCNFEDIHLCLPVYNEQDIAFQFIVTADTEEEADNLCDLQNEKIVLGVVLSCDDDFLVNFPEANSTHKPDRYRIGARQILYNWSHGIPGMENYISVGQCFFLKAVVDGLYSFCSSCFQRIAGTCHTSVIEYSNEENAFGFNYCNSEESIDGEACQPTIIQFTNEEIITIPYTTALQNKYGQFPSVQVWIYDENSELVNAGLVIKFDAYPPTQFTVNLGGQASGIIKIM